MASNRTETVEDRLDRLERALVEVAQHPALYQFGQRRTALPELVAAVTARQEEAK